MQCILKLPSLLLFVITSSVLIFTIHSDNLYANNLRKLFSDSKLELGGWIHGGATLNPSQNNGFNGPVIFADQANRFQLNQFNLYMRRPVVSEGKVWDFGGRFDFSRGAQLRFGFEPRTCAVGSGRLRVSLRHRAQLCRHFFQQLFSERLAADSAF